MEALDILIKNINQKHIDLWKHLSQLINLYRMINKFIVNLILY